MREWAAMAGGRDDDDDTDFMEAEREAMLGGGSDNPEDNMPRVSIRVLNQDEIDSLLGFDDYSTRENLLINGLDENGNPVEVNGMEEGGDPEVREYERGFAK